VSTDAVIRAAVIVDLLQSFEGHRQAHRACSGLAGSILEVTVDSARWGVAWMRCPDCGVRWERRLALNGAP
jgi:hypothetical protein